MAKHKGNHDYEWGECGYGGGPTADVWCKKCKKSVEIPVEFYKYKQPKLYQMWVEIVGKGDPNAQPEGWLAGMDKKKDPTAP